MLNVSDTCSFYAARAGEREHARQVGWRDQAAQYARFEQFLRAIGHDRGEPFVVADVGCGLGDLFPFLRQKGFASLVYRGYDILPEMVERARELCGDADAGFVQIEHIGQVETADYCFASGIFNQKLGHSADQWQSYVEQSIRELATKSRHAAAFNILSLYSDEDRRDPDLFYADPCRLFDWCKREVTGDVALLHDYGNWDFTIILRMSQQQPGGAAA